MIHPTPEALAKAVKIVGHTKDEEPSYRCDKTPPCDLCLRVGLALTEQARDRIAKICPICMVTEMTCRTCNPDPEQAREIERLKKMVGELQDVIGTSSEARATWEAAAPWLIHKADCQAHLHDEMIDDSACTCDLTHTRAAAQGGTP